MTNNKAFAQAGMILIVVGLVCCHAAVYSQLQRTSKPDVKRTTTKPPSPEGFVEEKFWYNNITCEKNDN
ncbi:MAG: hypothetical protein Q4F84_04160 [Fibrobacter sp.]|nr:hypothetical protein [Fibrobacter sp.]